MSAATRTKGLESRTPTHICDKQGCTNHTRERKPYCSEHIEEIGRVSLLMGVLEGVEKEIEEVGREGPRAVDMNGLVVEEILAGLEQVGSITWRRLCKNHVNFLNRQPATTVDHYLTRLKSAGLVQIGSNKRNSRVVSLTPKGLKLVKGES